MIFYNHDVTKDLQVRGKERERERERERENKRQKSWKPGIYLTYEKEIEDWYTAF